MFTSDKMSCSLSSYHLISWQLIMEITNTEIKSKLPLEVTSHHFYSEANTSF